MNIFQFMSDMSNYDTHLRLILAMQEFNKYYVVEGSELSKCDLLKMSKETIHSYHTLANIFPAAHLKDRL